MTCRQRLAGRTALVVFLVAGSLGRQPTANAGRVLRSGGAARAFLEAHAAHRQLKKLQRAAAANPGDADCSVLVERARRSYESKRTRYHQALKSTPLLQLLAGVFVDGPRDTIGHIRKHPVATAGIVLAAAAITTATGGLGVPVELIAIVASGGLTIKSIADKRNEVRLAFHEERRDRWRTLGEDVIYPPLVFGAGMGASAIAEQGVVALEGAVPALRVPALEMGASSTAQLLDDLVPVAAGLDRGNAPSARAPRGRGLNAMKARLGKIVSSTPLRRWVATPAPAALGGHFPKSTQLPRRR